MNKPNPLQKIINHFKKLIVVFLLMAVLGGVLVIPVKTQAIPVEDPAGVAVQLQGDFLNRLQRGLHRSLDKIEGQVMKSFGEMFLGFIYNTIDIFAQKFASDTATKFATMARGQKPNFHLDTYTDFLRNSADMAAGNFIEELSKEWQVDLCKPLSLDLQLKISVALFKIEEPKQPKCTFTKMRENWQQAIGSDDFLKNFSASFDPKETDIGSFLTLQERLAKKKMEQQTADTLSRGPDSENGIKPLTEIISGRITTTAKQLGLVQGEAIGFPAMAWAVKNLTLASNPDHPIVSSLAKAGTTFLTSLSNQLMSDLLSGAYKSQKNEDAKTEFCKKNPAICRENVSDLQNPTAQGGRSSRLALAEANDKKFVKTTVASISNYDPLPSLFSCDNSKNPGPNTCVIDQNFAQAINSKMTLKEAIENNLIDGNRPFGVGFGAKKGENVGDYIKEYTYRNILILRKYRVVPVGWELAAQYGVVTTLNDLIKAYNVAPTVANPNPYYKLVDPNWVLKMPSGRCNAKGFGPEIVSDTVDLGKNFNENEGDTDYNDPNDILPSRSIVRSDQYCADEKSCIREKTDGSCSDYGYCMEEKRLWKFEGEQCDPVNNTCQSFTNPQGATVSYLKNSIDWRDCDGNTAGCQWYCRDFNPAQNSLVASKAVAYWGMDEITNQIIKDQISSSNGTVSGGVSLVNSKDTSHGKALDFNGTDGSVKVADNSNFGLSKNLTLSAWVKTSSNNIQDIISRATHDSATVIGQNDYQLGIGGSGEIRVEFFTKSFGYESFLADNVADGNWHFVVATFDGENIKIYKDGLLKGLTKWQKQISVAPKSDLPELYIGQSGNGAYFFDGSIDDVAIYGRALSANEIWNNYISYSCLNQDKQKIYLSGKADACDKEQAGCGSYRTPHDGLIGFWQFDETDVFNNDILDDSSGYRNDAKLSSGDLIDKNSAGKIGNALQFDGVDDSLRVTNNNTFNNTINAFTVSAWVYDTDTDDGTDDDRVIMTKGANGGATGNTFRFELNNDKNLSLILSDGTSLQYFPTVTSSTIISNNTWTHVVATFDGTSVVMYINGVADGPASAKTINTLFSAGDLVIGQQSDADCSSAHSCWQGSLDEVSLWDRALSSTEIADIFDNGINFNRKNVKVANANLQCFGRTAGDAIFDLPVSAQNCLSLGPRYDIAPSGSSSCFEFLSIADKDSCTAGGGSWSNTPLAVPRYTNQTACESVGGTWGTSCQAQCLKLDDAVCSKYAFNCKKQEVGCEKYTSVSGVNKTGIPAVVGDDDFCPASCAGYDTYKQESTNFETSQFPVNFIPSTAKGCSATTTGCDEFTNLGSANGESLSYFSFLRQCEKLPAQNSTAYQCGDFYTWVGSEATGYQLQSYFLKSTGTASAENPVEVLRVEEDLGRCQDANDALENENCKEFYNSAGVISYHLLPKTVSCSNDCVDYRKTIPAEFNIAQICSNIGGSWNDLTKQCNASAEEPCRAVNAWNPLTSTCGLLNISEAELCGSTGGYLGADWGLCEGVNSTSCLANGGTWQASSSKCVNITSAQCTTAGGNYSAKCTKTDFKGIPTEGVACSASASGCREYTGNTGNNTRIMFSDTFESSGYFYSFPDGGAGWLGGEQSSESTVAGQKSLRVTDGVNQIIEKWLSAKCTLGATCPNSVGCDCTEDEFGAVGTPDDDGDGVNNEVVCKVAVDSKECLAVNSASSGNTYLLSFWAKGNDLNSDTAGNTNAVVVDIFDSANALNIQTFGKVNLSNQWKYYTLGPLEFKTSNWGNYKLRLSKIGSHSGAYVLPTYIDNVKLESVTDSIYIIKDSWNTPAVCDQDYDGNPYLYFMLGCDAYNNSQNQTSYLKSFSTLCRDEAVGCQALIDTHNSTATYEEKWNWGTSSEILVPSDNLVYLARTDKFACSTPGCSALGLPTYNQDKTVIKSINEVYKINNPDAYGTTLCQEKNVGCETFSAGNSSYFFKDPQDQICEYVKPGDTTEYDWYKKADKYTKDSPKCPTYDWQNFGNDFPSGECIGGTANGNPCMVGWDDYLAKQCTDSGGACQADGGCTGPSTIATTSCRSGCTTGGGYCNKWVGNCPVAQSSCTAFVDPISEFGINLVANDNFARDLNTDNTPDSWNTTSTTGAPINGYVSTNSFVDATYLQPGTELFKNIDIRNDKSYVLSADIQFVTAGIPALVQLTCSNYPGGSKEGVYLLDDSGNLFRNGSGDHVIQLPALSNNITSSFKRFSLRFFSGNCNKVKLIVGGENVLQRFTNVSLREAGIYYYFNDSLDEAKQACSNVVDRENGCVLVNDRSGIYRNNTDPASYDYFSYLTYNADDLTATKPTTCVAGENCNTNTLIKVKPDRDCGKWLYCNSTEKVGNTEVCKKVGICDALNESGQCISTPLEYSTELGTMTNMTFDGNTVDKIKNLTGYSKVGYDWGGGKKTEGNASPAQMQAVGATANLLNGGFEEVEETILTGKRLKSTWVDSTPYNTLQEDSEWFRKPKNWNVLSKRCSDDEKEFCNKNGDCQDRDGAIVKDVSGNILSGDVDKGYQPNDICSNNQCTWSNRVPCSGKTQSEADDVCDMKDDNTDNGSDTCDLSNSVCEKTRRGASCKVSGTPCLNVSDVADDTLCPLNGQSDVCNKGTGKCKLATQKNCEFNSDCEDTCVPKGNIPCKTDIDCPLFPRNAEVVCQNWQPNYFDLIDNPKTAQDESVSIKEGINILRLTAGSFEGRGQAVSDDIEVFGDETYVVSGYINTKLLHTAKDVVSPAGAIIVEDVTNYLAPQPVKQPSLSDPLILVPMIFPSRLLFNSLIPSDPPIPALKLDIGSDWQFVQGEFTTPVNTSRIRVRLADLDGVLDIGGSDNFCVGCTDQIFFDDITIKKSLRKQEASKQTDPHAPLSCRLYPQAGSLACEYSNTDGYIYQGLYGYCLESDPTNPDYCLNWYPIDTIAGSKKDENVGLNTNNAPLYYCLQERRTMSCTYDDANDRFSTPVPGDATTYCDIVTAVTEDSGANKAWAGRTQKANGYTNPIGYNYSTKPKLFGRIDPQIGDPEQGNWLKLDDANPVAPYNANAYAPYSCETTDGGHCSVFDNPSDYTGVYSDLINPDSKYNIDYSAVDSDCLVLSNASCQITDEDYFYFLFGDDGDKIYSGVLKDKNSGSYDDCFVIQPDGSLSDVGGGDESTDDGTFDSIMDGCPLSLDIGDDYNQALFPRADIKYGSGACVWSYDDDSNSLTPNNWYYAGIDKYDTSDDPRHVKIMCRKIVTSQSNNCNVPVFDVNNNNLSKLFVKNYNTWNWDEGAPTPSYVLDPNPGLVWNPPTDNCDGEVRPDPVSGDYCYINPQITNTLIDKLVYDGGQATLKFNSVINTEQLPMVEYLVDWKDGVTDGETGVSMFDRPNINNPHVLSHQYFYSALNQSNNPAVSCANDCSQDANCKALAPSNTNSFCAVTPSISIADNWDRTTTQSAPTVYVIFKN